MADSTKQTVNELNADFNLEAEQNKLSPEIRQAIADGFIFAEKTDVLYTAPDKKQHRQYFLRLKPHEKRGETPVLPAEQLRAVRDYIVTDDAETVKFILAGKDSADRLEIRSQIVTAVEGAGKAFDKAEASISALKSTLPAEQFAAIMAALEAGRKTAAEKSPAPVETSAPAVA
jgi:hypothetical protein